MTSEQIVLLIPAFAGGTVIGILNYLGLWLTVKKVPSVRNPALHILTSMAVRISLTMAAFFMITGHEWQRLLACVAGYFLVRLLSILRIGNSRPAAASG